MASKLQTVTPTGVKPLRKRTGRRLTMFMLKGDPVQALKRYGLPPGAKVAIVSSGPRAARKLSAAVGKGVEVGAEITIADLETELPVAVIDKAAFEPDARSRAIVEGMRIAERDLKEAGGAYDLAQVRTLMRGVSRQAVDKRVQDGRLLAVPGPSNRRVYPTLQFNRDGSIVPGLKEVQDALPTRSPWTILNFLSRSDARLGGRRPIDLLKEGRTQLVVEAAQRYGEQGA